MEKEKMLQEKIDQEKKKLADFIINHIIPPCSSHIYKRDLWGQEKCIFCGRVW